MLILTTFAFFIVNEVLALGRFRHYLVGEEIFFPCRTEVDQYQLPSHVLDGADKGPFARQQRAGFLRANRSSSFKTVSRFHRHLFGVNLGCATLPATAFLNLNYRPIVQSF